MAELPPDKQGTFDPALARRLHQALTADAEGLFVVVLDPALEVLRAALRNPRLNEAHLLALLKRKDLPEDILKAVYRLEAVAGSHRLKVALAMHPAAPGQVVLALLPHLFLFELLNICILPGPTPDQKLAAERTIIRRLSTLELGNKMTLARRGTASLVGEILKEGDPRLVEVCLANPQLREVSLLQFLNGPKADADTISLVARQPRWQGRPNLRLAILRHPRTPSVWFTLWLPKLKVPDLRSLVASRRLKPEQRRLVKEELRRRGNP